jgi:HEAT repeat protein
VSGLEPLTHAEEDMVRRGLSDPDARVRAKAAGTATYLAVWEWHDTSALVSELSTVIRSDPDAAVRQAAAEALGYTYAPEAVSVLLSGLEDIDPRVRASAEAALHHIFDTI